jgi:ATP-dependent protease Clp ATPase subunit
MKGTDRSNGNSLCCSFCGTSQSEAEKLISSPIGTSRAYICDACVATCATVIQDDKLQSEVPRPDDMHKDKPPHPLLGHPLASDLMQAVEQWIREQSLGKDGLVAVAEVRRIAAEILSESQGGSYARQLRL